MEGILYYSLTLCPLHLSMVGALHGCSIPKEQKMKKHIDNPICVQCSQLLQNHMISKGYLAWPKKLLNIRIIWYVDLSSY